MGVTFPDGIALIGDERVYDMKSGQTLSGKSNWVLEIVKRSADAQGFELLKKRWIVERTLGWFGWYRRLSKDYEELTVNSEAMILVCMIHRMLRHLKPAELASGWEK